MKDRTLLSWARAARKNGSVAEQIMWQALRASKLGFKFRREFVIGQYRLDFFCAEALLAVELDGEQHDAAQDGLRDEALAKLGILTYRIPNREFFMLDDGPVINHLAKIRRICEERAGRKAFGD